MSKFPFTSEGIASLQRELYKLDDHALLVEVEPLCSDTLDWIALKFELTVHQLEAIRGIREYIRKMWGISLAQAILCRRPFAIQFYDYQANFNDFIVTSSINFRYSTAKEAFFAGGVVTINFDPA